MYVYIYKFIYMLECMHIHTCMHVSAHNVECAWHAITVSREDDLDTKHVNGTIMKKLLNIFCGISNESSTLVQKLVTDLQSRLTLTA